MCYPLLHFSMHLQGIHLTSSPPGLRSMQVPRGPEAPGDLASPGGLVSGHSPAASEDVSPSSTNIVPYPPASVGPNPLRPYDISCWEARARAPVLLLQRGGEVG